MQENTKNGGKRDYLPYSAGWFRVSKISGCKFLEFQGHCKPQITISTNFLHSLRPENAVLSSEILFTVLFERSNFTKW